MTGKKTALTLFAFAGLAVSAFAQSSPYESAADYARYARMLSENALLKVEPQVFIPTTLQRGKYPWKTRIVTTTFWIGEQATRNNPVPNHKSSWDGDWARNYGGFDNPDRSQRRGFIPVSFTPRQNPFYVALPYNDVSRGKHKSEAARVIPWFKEVYEEPGKSVCKDRWIAIRHGNRTVYAQWEDCGPFRTDHWEYVFGNDRPLPNLNKGAGLDVSPAVRDYLGMESTDTSDWRFVEEKEVPPGPWRLYGDNNTFVINKRKADAQTASARNDAVPRVQLNN